jgi:hypothetical protein
MEQSYLEKFHSQQIPRILWNSEAHYQFHKYPPSVRIQNKINPVCASIPHLEDPF